MYPICGIERAQLKSRSGYAPPLAQSKSKAFDDTLRYLARRSCFWQSKFKRNRKQLPRMTKHAHLTDMEGSSTRCHIIDGLESSFFDTTQPQFHRLSFNNNCNRFIPNSNWGRNSVSNVSIVPVNPVVLHNDGRFGPSNTTTISSQDWSTGDRFIATCVDVLPSYCELSCTDGCEPLMKSTNPIFLAAHSSAPAVSHIGNGNIKHPAHARSGSFPADGRRKADLASMDSEESSCHSVSFPRHFTVRKPDAAASNGVCLCGHCRLNHVASAPPIYCDHVSELGNSRSLAGNYYQQQKIPKRRSYHELDESKRLCVSTVAVENCFSRGTIPHDVTRICRSVPVEFMLHSHGHSNYKDMTSALFYKQQAGILENDGRAQKCDHLGPNRQRFICRCDDGELPVGLCSYRQYSMCLHPSNVGRGGIQAAVSSNNLELTERNRDINFCSGINEIFDRSAAGGNRICNHMFNGDSVKTMSSHSLTQHLAPPAYWHPYAAHPISIPGFRTDCTQFTDLKHADHRSLLCKRSVSECLPSHRSLAATSQDQVAGSLLKEFQSRSDDLLFSTMREMNHPIMYIRPRPSLALFSTTSDDSYKYSERFLSTDSHGFAKSSCSEIVADGQRIAQQTRYRRRRRYQTRSRRRGGLAVVTSRDTDERRTASDDSDEYDSRRVPLKSNSSVRQRGFNGKASYVNSKTAKRLRYVDQPVEDSDEVVRNSVAGADDRAAQAQSTKSPPTGGAVDESDDQDSVSIKSPSGRFIRLEEIGRGAFKTVYKGLDSADGVAVAWCELQDVYNRAERMRFREEVKLLKELQHPNIVRFFDHWVYHHHNRRIIVLVTELMTSGSLKAYLRNFKSELNPKKLKIIKSWCRQILQGLAYMHSRKPPVIHRDLKCDNIFISGTTGSVKIGDLGLAVFKTETFAKSMRGTMEFMAPEMFDELYDEMVDVYSFGLCVLELVSGEYPYMECRFPTAVMKKVISGLRPDCYYKVKVECVREIIDCCIRKNKNERLTAKELLKHSFFMENNGLVMETVHPSNRRATLADRIVEFKLKIEDSSKRVHSLGQSDALAFKFDVQLDNPEKICAELLEKKLIFEDDVQFVAQSIRDKLRALHYEQLDELEKVSTSTKSIDKPEGGNNKVNAFASTSPYLASTNGVTSKSPEVINTSPVVNEEDKEVATTETSVATTQLDPACCRQGDLHDKLSQTSPVVSHPSAVAVAKTSVDAITETPTSIDKSVAPASQGLVINNDGRANLTAMNKTPGPLTLQQQQSPQPALNIQEAALIAANVASNRFTVVPHSMKTGELEFTSGDRSDDQLYGMQSIKLSQIKRVQITVISIAKNQVKCLFEIPGVFIEFLFDRARFKPEIVGSVLSSMIVKRSTKEDIDHYKIPLTMSCIECLNDIVKSIGPSTANGDKRVIAGRGASGGNVFTSEVKLDDSSVQKLNTDKLVDSIKHKSNSYKQSFVVSKMNVDKNMIGVASPPSNNAGFSKGSTNNGPESKLQSVPAESADNIRDTLPFCPPKLNSSPQPVASPPANTLPDANPADTTTGGSKTVASQSAAVGSEQPSRSVVNDSHSGSCLHQAGSTAQATSQHHDSRGAAAEQPSADNSGNKDVQKSAPVTAAQGVLQQASRPSQQPPATPINMPCRSKSCLPTIEHSSIRSAGDTTNQRPVTRECATPAPQQTSTHRSNVKPAEISVGRSVEAVKCTCSAAETVPMPHDMRNPVEPSVSSTGVKNHTSSVQKPSTQSSKALPVVQPEAATVQPTADCSSECSSNITTKGNPGKAPVVNEELKGGVTGKDSSTSNRLPPNAETASVGVIGGTALAAAHVKNSATVPAGQATESPLANADTDNVKMNKTTGYQQDLQQLDKNLKQALGRPKPSDSAVGGAAVTSDQKDALNRERKLSNDTKHGVESCSDENHRRGSAGDDSKAVDGPTKAHRPAAGTEPSKTAESSSLKVTAEGSSKHSTATAKTVKAPSVQVTDRFTVIPLHSDIASPMVGKGAPECSAHPSDNTKRPQHVPQSTETCRVTAQNASQQGVHSRVSDDVAKKQVATQTEVNSSSPCSPPPYQSVSANNHRRPCAAQPQCSHHVIEEEMPFLRRPGARPVEQSVHWPRDMAATSRCVHAPHKNNGEDDDQFIKHGGVDDAYMRSQLAAVQRRCAGEDRSDFLHFVPQGTNRRLTDQDCGCYDRVATRLEQFLPQEAHTPPSGTFPVIDRVPVRRILHEDDLRKDVICCDECKMPVFDAIPRRLIGGLAEKIRPDSTPCSQHCSVGNRAGHHARNFMDLKSVQDSLRPRHSGPFCSSCSYNPFIDTAQQAFCFDKYRNSAAELANRMLDIQQREQRFSEGRHSSSIPGRNTDVIVPKPCFVNGGPAALLHPQCMVMPKRIPPIAGNEDHFGAPLMPTGDAPTSRTAPYFCALCNATQTLAAADRPQQRCCTCPHYDDDSTPWMPPHQPWKVAYDLIDRQKQELFYLLSEHRQQIDDLLQSLSASPVVDSRTLRIPGSGAVNCTCANCRRGSITGGPTMLNCQRYHRPECQLDYNNGGNGGPSANSDESNVCRRMCPPADSAHGHSNPIYNEQEEFSRNSELLRGFQQYCYSQIHPHCENGSRPDTDCRFCRINKHENVECSCCGAGDPRKIS